MTRKILFALILAAILLPRAGLAEPPVRFESIKAYNDMRGMVEKRFKPGSDRDDLRRVFTEEGKATQVTRPGRDTTEKYIYDINLCGFYIFRWNISADYTDDGKLLQAYVNGLPVFMAGPALLEPKGMGAKTSYASVDRPRPQVTKGKKKVPFMQLDIDGDPATIDDQFATGHGPSRADPYFLDAGVSYKDVEVWRSIYDADDAAVIADYPSCGKPEIPQEIKDLLKLPQ
ncbi:MAG: hypothetical protein IT560_05310 [Alphaproteobacteria bacterium]|nr:hypothetical protein [Alphaproteobacteria bacterium]